MISPLVAANWKMNGSQVFCVELAHKIVRDLAKKPAVAEVLLAPPFTALSAVEKATRRSKIKIAAQNCHWQDSGAFTGEISPSMLREIGCDFVILGHSERRHIFHESDDLIARKVPPVIDHGMRPILCVGETIEERRNNQTAAIIRRQLDSALKGVGKGDIDKVEIAYEPVWAIGTGRNAAPAQAQEAHAFLRSRLAALLGAEAAAAVRILYGGSVKPDNAAAILTQPDVDGALVGGASLDVASFWAIIQAAPALARG